MDVHFSNKNDSDLNKSIRSTAKSYHEYRFKVPDLQRGQLYEGRQWTCIGELEGKLTRMQRVALVLKTGLKLVFTIGLADRLDSTKEDILSINTGVKKHRLFIEKDSKDLGAKVATLFQRQSNNIEKKEWITKVKQGVDELDGVPEPFKSDVDVNYAAVEAHPEALKHVPLEIQRGLTVVHIAIKKDPLALQYAHEELRGNREVVFAAVLSNGLALQFASDALQNDQRMAINAITQNFQAIQYVSENLKSDPEFARTAIGINRKVVDYAPELAKLTGGQLTDK